MWNFIKKHKLFVSTLFTLTVITAILGVQFDFVPKGQGYTIGQGSIVLRIGTAEASGTVDYVCDGTDDDIQFQGALDALPANGGTIEILAGNYDLANATTVTRALANVTIVGTGRGTYITCDGATAIFTAGGNNWQIKDLRTDAGSLNMGATTGWSWENITINATYYAYRTDDATTASSWNIPTGRGATYVIAASNSTAIEKAQADVICDGTADNVEINAAITAMTRGGTVQLLSGDYYVASTIILNNNYVTLAGVGRVATFLKLPNGANCNIIGGNGINYKTMCTIRDLGLEGNESNNATGNGIDIDSLTSPFINNVIIQNMPEDGITCDNTFTNGGAVLTNVRIASCVKNGIEVTTYGLIMSSVYTTLNGYSGASLHGGELNIVNYNSDRDCITPPNANYRAFTISGSSCSNLSNIYVDGGDGGGADCSQNYSMLIASSNDINITNLMIDGGSVAGGHRCLYVYDCDGVHVDNFWIDDSVNDGGRYGIYTYDSNHCSYTNGFIECDANVGTIGIFEHTDCSNNIFSNNDLTYCSVKASISGVNTLVSGNTGYIGRGELRTISIAITAGNEHQVTSLQNLFGGDVLIVSAYLSITTAASASNPTYDMGTDDDGAGVPSVALNLFDGVADTVGYYSAQVAGSGGTLTVPILWQATGNDWVNFIIEDANGADTAGVIYITVIGK